MYSVLIISPPRHRIQRLPVRSIFVWESKRKNSIDLIRFDLTVLHSVYLEESHGLFWTKGRRRRWLFFKRGRTEDYLIDVQSNQDDHRVNDNNQMECCCSLSPEPKRDLRRKAQRFHRPVSKRKVYLKWQDEEEVESHVDDTIDHHSVLNAHEEKHSTRNKYPIFRQEIDKPSSWKSTICCSVSL